MPKKVVYVYVTVKVAKCEECPHYNNGGGFGEPWCYTGQMDVHGSIIDPNCPFLKGGKDE